MIQSLKTGSKISSKKLKLITSDQLHIFQSGNLEAITALLKSSSLNHRDLTPLDRIEIPHKSDPYRSPFIGAKLVGVNLRNTHFLEKSILREADLSEANCEGARLNGVDFSFTNCTLTRFTRAQLVQANFTYAMLRRAEFLKANITGADFYRAKDTFWTNLHHAIRHAPKRIVRQNPRSDDDDHHASPPMERVHAPYWGGRGYEYRRSSESSSGKPHGFCRNR